MTNPFIYLAVVVIIFLIGYWIDRRQRLKSKHLTGKQLRRRLAQLRHDYPGMSEEWYQRRAKR